MPVLQTIADVHEYKDHSAAWPGVVEAVASSASGTSAYTNQVVVGYDITLTPTRDFKIAIQLGALNVPRNTTFSTATLSLAVSNCYKQVDLRIKGALGASALPTPGSETITALTLTSAQASSDNLTWQGADAFGNWTPSPNPYQVPITNVLNEIVAHASWDSGDSPIIVVDFDFVDGPTGRMQLWSNEHATNNASTLNYETGTATSITSVSGDDFVQLGETDVRVAGVNIGSATNLVIGNGTLSQAQTIKSNSSTEIVFDLTDGSLTEGSGYTLSFNKGGIIYTRAITLGANAGGGSTTAPATGDNVVLDDGHEYAINNGFPGTYESYSISAQSDFSADPDTVVCGLAFNSYWVHAHFKTAAIDADPSASMTNCLLDLVIRYAYKRTDIKVQAVANPAAADISGANKISAQTLTTASVSASTTIATGYDAAGDWSGSMSIDVSSVVQEVVNHANWVKDSSIQLVLTFDEISGERGHIEIHALESANTAAQFSYDASASTTSGGASTAPTLDAFGQTVRVGDTGISLSGTNLQNASVVRVIAGGITVTQTIASSSTNEVVFDFVQATLGFGAATIQVVASGQTLTASATLAPATDRDYIVLDSINTTSKSLAHNANPAMVTSDLIEFETTSANGFTVDVLDTGIPTIAGGSGQDSFTARYRGQGEWGDDFTVRFSSEQYFTVHRINTVDAIVVALPVFDMLNDVIIETVDVPIEPIASPSNYASRVNGGFNSVNNPQIRIVEREKEVLLYVDRDNTIEVEFTESKDSVDLSYVDRIDLIIGNEVFSDTDPRYAQYFTKRGNGLLEVQMGELGMPVGEYNFAFILYTPDHNKGVVWNLKSAYKVIFLSHDLSES